MKKLIRIDDTLLEAIQKNAKTIGNTATKEINEMLWLALKPRTEQIKKVLETRTSTIDQLNITGYNKDEQWKKPTPRKILLASCDEEYTEQDAEYDRQLEEREKRLEEWEKAEKETIDACNQICEDDL